MKVAIYEPDPRVCGPMAWAYHLQSGFIALGHDCDVVTGTKSGKPSSTWNQMIQSRGARCWARPPDKTFKFKEIIAALNTYDLVILSDVAIVGHDKTATKEGTMPVYVHIMRSLKVPWMSAMHGNPYPEKKTPYLQWLMDSPYAIKTWMTCNWDNVASATNPLIQGWNWEFSHLPYRMVTPDDAPLPPHRTVGMTGRFIFNKGQPTMALATSMLESDTTCEIWGASSVGLGPSPTALTYKSLVELDPDAQRVRFGPEESRGDPMGGNIITPYLWDVRLSTGQLIRYLGTYDNAVWVCSRMGVHVSLTASTFSGAIEFAALEAMDAGSVPIVTENVSHPAYEMVKLPSKATWSTPEKQVKDGLGNLRELADVVQTTLDMPASERRKYVDHNRNVVRDLNLPANVAAKFLEVAGR